MKEITFINTHLFPDEKYGGVVYSGDGLFRGLARKLNVFAVTTSSDPNKVEDYYNSQKNKVKCFKSIFSHKLGFSISIIFGLPRIISKSKFVVINGIYTFPVTYAALLCVLFKTPFSVALRGGYEPWRLKQKRWKKSVFNLLVTNPILKKSSFIHVISKMEALSVPKKYNEKIEIIPNGFDFSSYEKYKFLKRESIDVNKKDFNFLFLSRMDKEKGLDIVFNAFKDIQSIHKNSKLKLVGPDNNGYLKSLLKTIDTVDYKWIPGLYGDDKIKEILMADVLILPSYSENFGNVILESLLFGTPVITSTGTPWGEIVPKVKCGWICEPEKESFLKLCIEAINTDRKELKKMGLIGQEFIKSNYSWDNIALTFSEKIKINLEKK